MLLNDAMPNGEPMSIPRQPTRAGGVTLKRTALALTLSIAFIPCAWAQATGARAATAKLQRVQPAVVGVTLPGAAAAAAVSPAIPCGRVEIAPAVQLSVGKSTVIRPPSPVTRVLLGNPVNSQAGRPAESRGRDDKREASSFQADDKLRPGVADVDVLLLGPSEVYLLGKSIGSTNVVLLDRSGQCTAFDVVVNMDTGALQSIITQLLPAETGVRVASAFDSVVLMGTVSDAGAVTRVMDLANAYVRNAGGGASVAGANPRIVNMMSTGAPQQVMLEVKVAEVSKALLDRFGVNFSRAYVPTDGSMIRFLSGIFGGTSGLVGQISGTVGAQIGGGAVGSSTNGQTTSVWTGQVGDAQIGDNPKIPFAAGKGTSTLGIDAQKTDGLVKVLAEPTVMAISGQKGSFLAGGKIFIPVAQESGAGGRSVTLEEKEFGVSVSFVPTVLDAGRINLEVASEVSELNREGVGLSAPGVNGLAVLPSFTSRRAKTTVQLVDGQSFAIGGLIKNNTTTNIKAFPVLGELPVVGALFRSTEFQTDKSELVFVITPRLVKPLPANYALPTDNYVPPTRTDLHVHGRLEGKRTEPSPDAPAPAASAARGGFQVK
jgi:pilus assembly protein CpaC